MSESRLPIQPKSDKVASRLDEIEERLKMCGATEWHGANRHGGVETGPYAYAHNASVVAWIDHEPSAALIVHAPADLALLVRAAKIVLKHGCMDTLDDGSKEWCGTVAEDGQFFGGADVSDWCMPCQFRRELEVGR